MKYLGIAKRQRNSLTMPDAFSGGQEAQSYEAIQVGDTILLLSAPLDRERLKHVGELADRSIADHRKSLEGLAR